LGVIQILTNTVNKYFGYVAWGLVIAAWAAGIFVWMQINKWYKIAVAPFIICPRCGHTFADKKRLGASLLKIVQPWTWFGL
jgi:exosortase/archaeosortase